MGKFLELNDLFAAQKAARNQAVRVVRETTDNFRVLMRRFRDSANLESA